VYRAALQDPAFRRQFGLLDWEEQLVAIDHGFASSCPTARLDSFFVSQNELRFTEFNAETPAAPAYNDVLTELFYGLPIVREFLRRFQLRPLPARHTVLHAILDSFEQYTGRREPPRIGILDWHDVPTYSEFLLFQDYFRSHGLDCVIADPRDVEYRAGRLMAGDFHITLIYKRVLISELIERCGMEHAIVRAVRDRAVCMVNPFRCKILYKKASLAVLCDERNAALFSDTERQAILDHVPWTRRVEDRHTMAPTDGNSTGQSVDLVPYILAHRERLVLKPNDDYGGKGIVLGWTVDDTAWRRAVDAALASPYVVQDRVAVPSEPFPSFEGGRMHIVDRQLDTNPYACLGEFMDGCLTRISTAALINVTAGGGSTIPTFLVES
jgi:hypothetical protein